MADNPTPDPEAAQLHDKFRKLKHDINNTLAVVMAIAELTSRKPDYFTKLTKTLLERWPATEAQLRELDSEFASAASPESARMHGVYRRFNGDITTMFTSFSSLAQSGPGDQPAMTKLANEILRQGGTFVEKMQGYSREMAGDTSTPPAGATPGFGIF